MARRLLHVIVFLVGLLSCAAYIRHLDRDMPFWCTFRQPAGHLLETPDSYDTLFIGSSRVARGFMPNVFDAEMNRLGHPVESFNLGVRGLRQHDYDAIIDWVLEHRPTNLKNVLIELHAFVQGPRDDNWMTSREIGMHTWPYLASRFVSIAGNRDDFSTKVSQYAHATAHTLANTFRVGQAPRIIDWHVARSNGRLPWRTKNFDDGGWDELSITTQKDERRRKQYEQWQKKRKGAERLLDKKRKNLTPASHCGGFNKASLRATTQRLRDAGIEPIFVVMPHYAFNFYGRDGVNEMRDEVTIFEFDVVAENEDLHAFELWFDWAHMIKPGAELFSKRLAERMHEHLRNK